MVTSPEHLFQQGAKETRIEPRHDRRSVTSDAGGVLISIFLIGMYQELRNGVAAERQS